MATGTMVRRKTRRHRDVSPLNWVHGSYSVEGITFANELLGRARIFSFDCGGRRLWFVPKRPTAGAEEEAVLHLLADGSQLRVGIRRLDDVVLLDKRFSSLSIEIYEPSVQEALLEALTEPFLQCAGTLLGGNVVLSKVELKRQTVAALAPFTLHFALYAANPHGNELAPLLLEGSITLDQKIAQRITKRVSSMEVARYRTYAAAIPCCLNGIASLSMGVEELATIRIGDVILLEDSKAIEHGKRQLIGLISTPIIAQQDDDQITIERIAH
jgi:hypothetical protein